MRNTVPLGILLAGLLGTACRLAAQEPPPAAPDAHQLIALLEKGDYDQRQDAVRKLEALGEAARPALEKALAHSPLLDVRETAERLLAALRKAVLVVVARDSQGHPVAGLSLGLAAQCTRKAPAQRIWPTAQPPSLTTDAHGEVRLKGLEPGAHYLTVDWRDAPVAGPRVLPQPFYLQGGENRVLYVLSSAGRLSGRVISARDGAPLAQAEVLLQPDEGEDPRAMEEEFDLPPRVPGKRIAATTDKDGAFLIEGVPSGSCQIAAVHDDFAPAWAAALRVREGAATIMEAPLRLTPRSAVCGALKVRVLSAKGEAAKKGGVDIEVTRVPEADAWDVQRAIWRRRFESRQSNPRANAPEPDENGWVEFKDLRAGVYRITVIGNQPVTTVYSDVRIEPGRTTALEGQKPPAGASLSGRVLFPAGGRYLTGSVRALPQDDPLTTFLIEELLRGRNWALSYRASRVGRFAEMTSIDDKGRYSFRDLRPGRYAVMAQLVNGRIGLILGAEAAEKKAAATPDLTFPVAKPPRATPCKLKGVVLRPDGKPACPARVLIQCERNQAMVSTDAEGKFSFERDLDADAGVPQHLLASLMGFRPCLVDLTQPNLNREDLELRLVAQSYGRVRVKVADPAGKPLPDVWVAPFSPYRDGLADWRRVRATDAEGRALLSGLAYGPRRFDAFLDGYYLPQPVEATVAAEQETPVSITLHPGLRLAGRVEAPPDADLRHALVYLRGFMQGINEEVTRTTRVDDGGNFEFGGVPPGKVMLALHAPPLRPTQSTEVEVAPGAAPVILKLARPGGLRVDFGPAGRGATVRCVAVAQPPPPVAVAQPPTAVAPGPQVFPPPQVVADSAGQAELYGLPAGPLDLLIRPRELPGETRTSAPAQQVLHGVDVPPLPGGPADLAKLAPLTPKTSSGLPWFGPGATPDGVVAGRVVLKSEANLESLRAMGLYGTLALDLIGADAVANLSFSFVQDFLPGRGPAVAQASGLPPAVAQASCLPPGLTVQGPGEFRITGVPPGEYRLYLTLQIGSRPTYYYAGLPPRPGKAEPPRLARTVTLAKDQRLDLGEVLYDLPPGLLQEALRRRSQNMYDMMTSQLGEDEALLP